MDLTNEFIKYCRNGQLIKAKIVFACSTIDIHAKDELAFRMCCRYGHLDVAKWLVSLENTQDNTRTCFRAGGASGKINIHSYCEHAFKLSCVYGHIEVAKWLISLENTHGRIDIHTEMEFSFNWSCGRGYIDVAKWLLSLESTHGKINIHGNGKCAFELSCMHDRLDVIKWLLSIDKFDNDLVDEYLPEQLHEYAFDLGYLPVKKMTKSYTQYKAKILEQIKDKNTNGQITIFEVKGLPEIICAYV
jgi:hypothetical protein